MEAAILHCHVSTVAQNGQTSNMCIFIFHERLCVSVLSVVYSYPLCPVVYK